MKNQDPDRNVDLVRNVLRDEMEETYYRLFLAEDQGDELELHAMLGAKAALDRIARRLQITTADEKRISEEAERRLRG